MEDKKPAKVIQLFGTGNTVAGRDVDARHEAGVRIGNVNGGTNVIGNHTTVHVHADTKKIRPLMEPVPPPVDRITDEQAAVLKSLHYQWVELSAAVKTRAKPITAQQAWVGINRAGQSRTYTHMRQVNFPAACAYVQQQMAILRSGKVARRRDPKWRTSRIGAIKARCINQLGNGFAYGPYIAKQFNAQSLTELDDDQLEATYRHILKLKAILPGKQ